MRGDGGWPELALIGGYPPPYGGVSVHVQRLFARLQQQAFDFRLYNVLSRAEAPRMSSVAERRTVWLLKFCLTHRCRLVHLVSTNWYAHLLFGLTARLRRGRYVLSVHNMETTDALASPGRRALTRWLLWQMDRVVVANEEIASAFVDHGIARQRIAVIPAFIPPERGAGTLPDAVERFAASHDPLMIGICFQAGQRYRGCDLYGVDMLIELVGRLRRERAELGLVIVLLTGAEQSKREIVERAARRGQRNILVVTEPLEDLIPLLQRADLFLRPTNTDGDANSVREALSLGVPVVASDAAPRPEGCTLFRSRDMGDFEQKVRGALSDLESLRTAVRALPSSDGAAVLLSLYRELIEADGCESGAFSSGRVCR